MKKLILVIGAFLALGMAASAQTPCSGGAQCVQTATASSTVGGDAVIPTMTNAAGNALDFMAWISCTSTNPNASTFVFVVNSGTVNHDSNGNQWGVAIDSQYAFTSTTRAVYHFWTQAPINAGSNSITLKNATGDCQALAVIGGEYTGFQTYNSGEYVKNGNFMPFANPDTNTTFPINANSSYVPLAAADLTRFCGINEGTAGSWTPNSGWALEITVTIGGVQIGCWDGTTGTAPSTISLNNSVGTSTHALGQWQEFNRVTTPSGRSKSYAVANNSTTASLNFSYVNGDVVKILVGGNVNSASIQPFVTSGCGTPVFVPDGSQSISTLNTGFVFTTVMSGSGSCTITETTTGTAPTAMAITNISGLPNGAIDVYGLPGQEQSGTCNAPVVTSQANEILGGFGIAYENLPGNGFTSAPGWSNGAFAESGINPGVAIGAFTGVGGAAGTQTFSTRGVGSNISGTTTCFVYALRQTLPSTGFQQANVAALASSTATTTLKTLWPVANVAGDHLRFLIVQGLTGGLSAAPTVTLTPTFSAGCTRTPTSLRNSEQQWNVDCPIGTSLGSTKVSAAITTSGGTLLQDVFEWEQISGQLVASSVTLADNARTTTTLTDLSSVYLPQSATYHIESWLESNMGPDHGIISTPSTGYLTRIYGLGNGNGFSKLIGMYDQDVTTSTPTTFDNQVTTPVAIGGGDLWGGQDAWTATTYNQPIVPAEGGGQEFSGDALINEPTSNCTLVVGSATNASSPAWAISSSPSLAWGSPVAGGTSSDQFAVWVGPSTTPTGNIDIAVTPGGPNTGLFTVLKVCNGTYHASSAVSTHASGTTTSPLTLPSVTTSQEIIGFAFNIGDAFFAQTYPQSPTYLIPFASNAANDNVTASGMYAFPQSSGAFTTTFNSLGSPTETMGALLLFDFSTPPPMNSTTVRGGTAVHGGTQVMQ